MNGEDDPKNMSVSRREGWVPCILKDYPEMHDEFAIYGKSPDDIIEIGGLILCITTIENIKAREAYYADQTRKETEAVNNSYLREQDARMPMFNESSSRTKFGRGM
jgi:hypothetical protein